MKKMSGNFELSPSVQERPRPRIAVYGPPGEGKTSFAAGAGEKVVFLATEDGQSGMPDIVRLPNKGVLGSTDELGSALNTLETNEHNFKWLAIDTIGGIEALLAEHVCRTQFDGKWNATKGGGDCYNSYGKGVRATAMLMKKFLGRLDALRNKKDMGIILLAHQGIHKSASMLGEDYFKFAPEMDKNSWHVVCAWTDIVGHAMRPVTTMQRLGEKSKVLSTEAERRIYFSGGAGRDAKCRAGYSMPESIPLNWDSFTGALNIKE
jgi:hypothetical protein